MTPSYFEALRLLISEDDENGPAVESKAIWDNLMLTFGVSLALGLPLFFSVASVLELMGVTVIFGNDLHLAQKWFLAALFSFVTFAGFKQLINEEYLRPFKAFIHWISCWFS